MIAGILLAAGRARRMGRPKLALPFRGRSLLAAAAEPLLASTLDRVLVVLGSDADEIRSAAGLPSNPRLRLLENAGWEEGMASSLRLGLAAAGAAEAVVLALGDLIGIDTALVDRVVTAARSGAPLIVPISGDRASHPVGVGRELFGELSALRGDVGAREVVARHFARAALVVGEPLLDLDTEDDYRRLLAGEAQARPCGLPLVTLPRPERPLLS